MIFTIFLHSCRNKKNCDAGFFENYIGNEDSLSRAIFIVDNVKNNKVCGYIHKFNYWIGASKNNQFFPKFQMNGFIYEEGNVIYFLPNGQTKPVKYFDFNMKIDSKQDVYFACKVRGFIDDTIKIEKSYQLILENKFYDNSKQDSIYKFRFSKFEIEGEDSDLVYYVGKNYGVAGVYTSILEDSIEEVISYRGDVYKSKQ